MQRQPVLLAHQLLRLWLRHPPLHPPFRHPPPPRRRTTQATGGIGCLTSPPRRPCERPWRSSSALVALRGLPSRQFRSRSSRNRLRVASRSRSVAPVASPVVTAPSRTMPLPASMPVRRAAGGLLRSRRRPQVPLLLPLQASARLPAAVAAAARVLPSQLAAVRAAVGRTTASAPATMLSGKRPRAPLPRRRFACTATSTGSWWRARHRLRPRQRQRLPPLQPARRVVSARPCRPCTRLLRLLLRRLHPNRQLRLHSLLLVPLVLPLSLMMKRTATQEWLPLLLGLVPLGVAAQLVSPLLVPPPLRVEHCQPRLLPAACTATLCPLHCQHRISMRLVPLASHRLVALRRLLTMSATTRSTQASCGLQHSSNNAYTHKRLLHAGRRCATAVVARLVAASADATALKPSHLYRSIPWQLLRLLLAPCAVPRAVLAHPGTWAATRRICCTVAMTPSPPATARTGLGPTCSPLLAALLVVLAAVARICCPRISLQSCRRSPPRS